MSTTQEKTSAPPAETEAMVAEAGSIDKIRDILFGEQSRDLEGRLSLLGERLAEDTTSIRAELRETVQSLEASTGTELQSLSTSLDRERSERKESVGDVVRQLKSAVESLEGRISKLGEEMSRSHSELRRLILDQAETVTEEGRRNHEVVVSTLDDRVRELRDEKADRVALADLFTEISLRLKDTEDSGESTESS